MEPTSTEQLLEALRREQQLRQEERRLRQQAEQRATDAEQLQQHAEQRQHQAEQRQHQEQQRADHAEQLRKQAEQRQSPTTLIEYISACHTYLYRNFAVQTDKTLTTKGTTTRPDKKRCPARLKAWPDFHLEQRKTLGTLHSAFPTEPKFENIILLQGLGERIAARRVANEKDLELVQHLMIEHPVQHILAEIGQVAQLRSAFRFDGKVLFENHPTAISNAPVESADSLQQGMQKLSVKKSHTGPDPESSSTSNARPKSAVTRGLNKMQLRADQICVYVVADRSSVGGTGTTEALVERRAREASHDTDTDMGDDTNTDASVSTSMVPPDATSERRMAFVVEYKAPHKLTLPCLLTGLHDMDIHRDVVNRETIPHSDDLEAKFQYSSELLTASAICQTYHYMLHGGLEYSYLTTGEAIVFLKIDWTDPSSLYYHLAQPGEEVEVEEEVRPEFAVHCTAISQILAFTLRALQSEPQDMATRDAAVNNAMLCNNDYYVTLDEVGECVRQKSLQMTSSDYRPRTYHPVDRSPIVLRSKRNDDTGCRPSSRDGGADSSPSSDDNVGASADTPLRDRTRASRARKQQDSISDAVGDTTQTQKPSRRRAGRTSKKSAEVGSDSATSGRPDVMQSAQPKRFCTQACLLGLVRGRPLDRKCPNVQRHELPYKDGDSDSAERNKTSGHRMTHKVWLQLLEEQLAGSIEGTIKPYAGKRGATGALFTVELLSHGYIFVAKGTTEEHRNDVRHEAEVYRRLSRLQGLHVPALLGALDLVTPYYYDIGMPIVYLLLQSMGGVEVCSAAADALADRSVQREGVRKVMEIIHKEGVVHRDIRSQNALWNPETKGVMFIDFERSKMIDAPARKRKRVRRPALGELPPNKQIRQSEGRGGTYVWTDVGVCPKRKDLLEYQAVVKPCLDSKLYGPLSSARYDAWNRLMAHERAMISCMI